MEKIFCLVLDKGEGSKIRFPLKSKKTTIGRDAIADIQIDDPKISRVHGEFIREGENLIYVDLNSTNGSYINSIPVKRRAIFHTDHILIGNSVLRVEELSEGKNLVFEEDKPDVNYITNAEDVLNKIDRISPEIKSQYPDTKIIGGEKDELASTENLMRNLKIIYDFSKTIHRYCDKKSIFCTLKASLFSMFPEAEHIYLFLYDQENKLQPELSASRTHKDSDKDVRVSRTLFNKAVNEKISILASNVLKDERFENLDSAFNINLLSAMLSPLIYEEKLVGILYIDNRRKAAVFKEDDIELLTAIAFHLATALENSREIETLQKSYHQALLALINAIESRDSLRMGHTQRTTQYSLEIAHILNLSEEQIAFLKLSSDLHEIGRIILKEFQVEHKTADESDKDNSEIAREIQTEEKFLKPIKYLFPVIQILKNINERYDGTGFPDGISGDKIPIESRIITLAKDFDIFCTQTPIRNTVNFKEALNQFKSLAGKKYDPEVVNALEIFVNRKYEYLVDDTDSKKKSK